MLKPPHPAQLAILQDKHQNVVVATSRRFGKTYAGKLKSLEVCADFDNWIASRGAPGYQIDPSMPPVVAILCPTIAQVRMLYWEPLLAMIKASPRLSRLVDKISSQQLSIRWKGNRPELRLLASEFTADRLRGLKFICVIADECQNQPLETLDDIVLTALADSRPYSQFFAIGTPLGQSNNALWQFKLRAEKKPDTWSFHKYSAFDNPFFDRAAILEEKATKTPASFRREFCASFEVFSSMIYETLSEENLVSPDEVPRSFRAKLLAGDWGSRNPFATVLGLANGVWYVLEGFGNRTGDVMPGTVFYDHLKRLARTWDVQASFLDPSIPANILDCRLAGQAEGIPGLVNAVGAFNSIDSGIQQDSNLIYQRRLKFIRTDERRSPNEVTGNEMFRLMGDYRYIQKDGLVVEKPEDGQPSEHCADCIRYGLSRQDPRKMTWLIDSSLEESQRIKLYDPRLDPDSREFSPALALATRHYL